MTGNIRRGKGERGESFFKSSGMHVPDVKAGHADRSSV